jgi:ribosomal protein S18 acetylase RimI-like enzyme
MTSSITFPVRYATLRDAKAISELYSGTLQEAFKGIVAADQIAKVAADKGVGYWREAIEYSEPHLQVALNGEKVIGFVGYDRCRDPKTPNTLGEIWDIYASPDYWGLGVGLALWDAAREGLHEEGCTNVSVWLPLANERALRFHELAGFKRDLPSTHTVPFGPVKIEQMRLKRSLA